MNALSSMATTFREHFKPPLSRVRRTARYRMHAPSSPLATLAFLP
jgi:hypothetical protein